MLPSSSSKRDDTETVPVVSVDAVRTTREPLPSLPPIARRHAVLANWLRRADRRPGLLEVVRRARRSLPGDPEFGDPLSMTGPGGARAVARAADRLIDDQNALSREVGLGALQVWQAMFERGGRDSEPTEVTLVFTDLVGFSAWALEAGDEQTLALLRRVASTLEPVITVHGGHVVKRMGDGLMAVFASPRQAVTGMVRAQEALADVRIGDYQPLVRVGVHTGTPQKIGSDWLGVDVNIAARLMESAGRGGLVVSEPVYAELDDELLAELGRTGRPLRRGFFSQRLTGVPESLSIFSLIPATE